MNASGEGTARKTPAPASRKPHGASSMIARRRSSVTFDFPWDAGLYEKLKAENEEELETFQKEEEDAEEKAGETEVQAAKGKRAEFWARVGDKVSSWRCSAVCMTHMLTMLVSTGQSTRLLRSRLRENRHPRDQNRPRPSHHPHRHLLRRQTRREEERRQSENPRRKRRRLGPSKSPQGIPRLTLTHHTLLQLSCLSTPRLLIYIHKLRIMLLLLTSRVLRPRRLGFSKARGFQDESRRRPRNPRHPRRRRRQTLRPLRRRLIRPRRRRRRDERRIVRYTDTSPDSGQPDSSRLINSTARSGSAGRFHAVGRSDPKSLRRQLPVFLPRPRGRGRKLPLPRPLPVRAQGMVRAGDAAAGIPAAAAELQGRRPGQYGARLWRFGGFPGPVRYPILLPLSNPFSLYSYFTTED